MIDPNIGSEAHTSRIPRSRRGWRWATRLVLAVLACGFAGAGQAQLVYQGGLDEAVRVLARTLVNEAGLRDERVLVESDDFFELETGLRLKLSKVLSRMSATELTRSGVPVAMPGSDEDAVMVLHGRWRRESDTLLYLELFVAAPVESGEPTALRSTKGRVPIDENIRKALESTDDDWGRLLVLRLDRGVRDRNKRTVHLQPMTIEGDGAQGGRLKQFLTNWLGSALVESRLFTLVEPPPGVAVETDGKLYVAAIVGAGQVEVSLRVADAETWQRVTFAKVKLDKKLFPPGVLVSGVDAELAQCAGHVEADRVSEAVKCYAGVLKEANVTALEGVEGVEGVEGLEGKTFRDCDGCPELVVVRSGSFMMGSPPSEEGRKDNEGPVHRVTIGYPFAVGVKEVTRGEYGRFVLATERSMGDSCRVYEGGEWQERSGMSWRHPGFNQTDEHPVVCVSHKDAKAYVDWLSEKTGEAYRLLSEAEWEYVARGETETARYWGESERGQCGYANGADEALKRRDSDWKWTTASCDDGYYRTSPVGSYEANGFGLRDVLGNVWEWVEDCWNENYAGAPCDGSAWESGECDRRVLRGGSWDYVPWDLRSASRDGDTTGNRGNNYGFRVARTLTP